MTSKGHKMCVQNEINPPSVSSENLVFISYSQLRGYAHHQYKKYFLLKTAQLYIK